MKGITIFAGVMATLAIVVGAVPIDPGRYRFLSSLELLLWR